MEMSNIHRIKCGSSNCYIVENGSGGILVDTGEKKFFDKVLKACKAHSVKLIVLTHAHCDHAENAARLSDALGIPIGMSERDCNLIPSNENQSLFAETFLGKIVLSVSLKALSVHSIAEFKPDVLLQNGDSLADYGVNARIVALPGHTDGSIGIDVDNKHLIVGDALMNMFYPTVSMLYHDRETETMLKSAERISGMKDRIIWFGHGNPVANRKWV